MQQLEIRRVGQLGPLGHALELDQIADQVGRDRVELEQQVQPPDARVEPFLLDSGEGRGDDRLAPVFQVLGDLPERLVDLDDVDPAGRFGFRLGSETRANVPLQFRKLVVAGLK